MLLTKDRSATDLRLPELDIQLPEFKVSDLKLPDMSDLKMPDISDLKMPDIDLPFSRRSSSRPWPLAVVGFAVVGIATWALMTNESLRYRIVDSLMAIRHRFDVLLTGTVSKPIDPVAFDATPTAPIDPDMPTTDPLYAGMTDYPEGLGSKGTARGNGETVKIR